MAAASDEAIAAAVRALGLVQPEISELEGGIANRSFRLRTRGRDLVLKLAADARHALGGSIHAECAMQELASRAGLAPPVVLADLSRGFIVSQHVAGRVPASAEFGDARMLGRVGAWIAALHALPLPPGLAAVDFGERAARCLARVVASGAGSFDGQLAQELERRRAAMPAPARLTACHHDLHHCNFIDDGTRLLAVDWEYAGPGDPAADLASCIGYQALDDAAVDALLAGYGRPGAALRSRIAALGWIFDCLWYAWNATAGLAGLAPDPAEQSRLAERLAR